MRYLCFQCGTWMPNLSAQPVQTDTEVEWAGLAGKTCFSYIVLLMFTHSCLCIVDFRAEYLHQILPVWSQTRCAQAWRREAIFWYTRGGATLWGKWFGFFCPLQRWSQCYSAFLIRSCWFARLCFPLTGFTTQQAEVLVKILVRMTNSNMDVIYNDMVTKVQQVRL